MIIKLEGADFSANNIGTLDIRTAPSAPTQAILDLYGKTWTLEQQLAIDDFLIGVQGASYYSKIGKLLLPILAPTETLDMTSTLSNYLPFYDLKNSAYVQAKVGVANSFYQIGSKGVFANTVDAGNSKGIRLDNFFNGIDKENCHFGVYHDSPNTTNALCGNVYNLTSNTESVTLGFGGSTATATFDINTKTGNGLRIASFTPSAITGLSKSLPLSSTAPSSSNADFSTQKICNLLSVEGLDTPIKINTNISLITLGLALTQPETVAYNTLINNLMSKLWI